MEKKRCHVVGQKLKNKLKTQCIKNIKIKIKEINVCISVWQWECTST